VSLGLLLGTCANHGFDKLTLIVSPRIYDLGAWLEQLIAESTGKRGHAVIPVDRETVSPPNIYSQDRVFAYVRLASAPDDAQDAAVEALVAAGRPVVRLDVADPYGLAGEFFRWEIATAVAGSVMGINPFDQPDVEASKIATRKLTSEFEATGALSGEDPVLEDDGMTFFTDEANAEALRREAGSARAASWLKAHLDRIGEGDYFAVLAYIAMNKAHESRLRGIRMRVRDRRGVATCLGFGPRCGDAIVQTPQEQCDDGINAGGYGMCQPMCLLGPRCGDGVVQSPEQCDDGNMVDNDLCTNTCISTIL
jgi:transaldolase/glucose-6-phosphate isomerase